MKLKYLYFVMLLSLGLIVYEGCAVSQNTRESNEQFQRPPDIEDPDFTISLIDHLRRVPGVLVRGSGTSASITIRGISSINSGLEPLFVINGQPISGGLQSANRMIPVNDIKSIRVLKNPGETGFYGVRGANGVVEIELKKE